MCQGCYAEAGSPKPQNAATISVAALVCNVYSYSSVGGNAHIVLDDWNVDDEAIDWCLTVALSDNVHEADRHQLEAERLCLEAMRALPLDQRYAALAVAEGLAEPKLFFPS